MHIGTKKQTPRGEEAVCLRLPEKLVDWVRGEASKQRRTIKGVIILMLEDAKAGRKFVRYADGAKDE
jgi:hypothetical protein